MEQVIRDGALARAMKIPPSIALLVGDLPMRGESIGRSNACVWRIGTQFYLKVGGATSEVADEADRLRWLAGRVPVPQVIVYERVDSECYLLTQALEGVAAHAVTQRLEAVRALAEGLRLLHGLDVRTCPFDARLAVTMAKARANALAGRVDESDFDDARLGRTARDLLGELEATRPEIEDLVVTHGDYCLPNVILRGGAVAGFIDVGRAGVADRHQDFACAARSIAYNYGDAFVAPFFDAYGVAPDPARIEFYQLLDEFF
ncbi:MAG TPA: APH(3') family aminoglycoside O-phosphotransferase [Pseudomonadales bacterium]|nr:APH(3') family aminoglycoside O-phosphotransferase [Pseudomonadales bacterium]